MRRRSWPLPGPAPRDRHPGHITCSAFLDDRVTPGRRALNDSSRRLNAPRSTTRRHRPGGTSRGSCSSWITAAPATKQPRRRMTVQPTDTTTGVEVTRCSRDQAQGKRRHHRGASGAGSAGGGSGPVHPAPSTGARPPAGSCLLTPPSSRTASPARPTASQQPSRRQPRPKEVPVQTPRTSLAQEQTAACTAPTGWSWCRDAARVRRARTRNQGGRSLPLESM
jgi:hypothetical protein